MITLIFSIKKLQIALKTATIELETALDEKRKAEQQHFELIERMRQDERVNWFYIIFSFDDQCFPYPFRLAISFFLPSIHRSSANFRLQIRNLGSTKSVVEHASRIRTCYGR